VILTLTGPSSPNIWSSFPDIPLVEIVGIVDRTRRAVVDFALPEAEHLATAEIIVRHQLSQVAGLDGSGPRLDPETHRGPRPSGQS
jgi:hypothetical protein